MVTSFPTTRVFITTMNTPSTHSVSNRNRLIHGNVEMGKVLFGDNSSIVIDDDVVMDLRKPHISDDIMTVAPYGRSSEQPSVDVQNYLEFPLTQSSVRDWMKLCVLGQKIVNSVHPTKYYCTPYKIFKHKQGIHSFDYSMVNYQHVDKTLVLHLPSEENTVGGNLLFVDDTFDTSLCHTSADVHYTLFNATYQHSVSAVKCGVRYSVTFSVVDVDKSSGVLSSKSYRISTNGSPSFNRMCGLYAHNENVTNPILEEEEEDDDIHRTYRYDSPNNSDGTSEHDSDECSFCNDI